jgi:hypothetical protein
MERAGRIVKGLRVVEIAGVKSYHLAPKAWTATVGRTVAAHSRPAFLDGTRLIVEVDDAVWQAQLTTLAPSILAGMAKKIGEGLVTMLEFRVAPQRRAPGLAANAKVAGPGLSEDEAERISDPVMRHLYRSARRKASS